MATKTYSLVAAATYQLADLKAAKKLCSQRWLNPAKISASRVLSRAVSPTPDQNIVGVGIGEKMVEKHFTGIMAVKILVRVKYAENLISAKDKLPKTVDGLPVDVEEVGTFHRLASGAKRGQKPPRPRAANATGASMIPNPHAKFRPAPPGCSIGFKIPGTLRKMAGTFGALVTDANGLYILSNNHVLANENNLPLNSPIFQPGLLDGGKPATDQIASLSRRVPLEVGVSNKVDCAVARISDSSSVVKEILHIGAPKSKGNASVGTEVHKFGRSTRYQVGRVSSIDTDVSVIFDTTEFVFQKQIIISSLGLTAFAEDGDSGALILERGTQKAVGLLFGVGTNRDGTTHAIANHINDVVDELGVMLVL